MGHGEEAGRETHHHIFDDYRRRFIVSIILTVPVLLLSLPVGALPITFPGSAYLLLALATAVYLYGGWPFLSGFVHELRARMPGMMTLEIGRASCRERVCYVV